MSASSATEGVSDLVSRGLSKSLGVMDLAGLKNLQNRSLRTRSMKASIKQRLKALAAEPLETLEVAREIDKLVSNVAFRHGRGTDSLYINSPYHSLHMKSSVAITSSSLKTWQFCVAPFPTGKYLIKESRHCQNPLLPWKAAGMKRTGPCQ